MGPTQVVVLTKHRQHERIRQNGFADAGQTRILRPPPRIKRSSAIGDELGVGRPTVKTHVEHIYRKLGATKRAEAVALAENAGLLPDGAALMSRKDLGMTSGQQRALRDPRKRGGQVEIERETGELDRSSGDAAPGAEMSSHAHAQPSAGAGASAKIAGAAKIALITLAAGQFVMALDTTVMNTAIATVAKDVGTTVTGIQTAITLYTLVMASLMITGGKIGQMIGRKRAFAIGCVIYACGSLTTALSHSLAVLMFGWSLLEGLGAVLIMPAIVALVASNFAKPERPRAYGLVAAVRRDRRGTRAADRRPLHHLRIVAMGVRRGGADRARDPRPGSPHERHAGRGRSPAGPGGHGLVRAGTRSDRVWDPEVGDLGLGESEA